MKNSFYSIEIDDDTAFVLSILQKINGADSIQRLIHYIVYEKINELKPVLEQFINNQKKLKYSSHSEDFATFEEVQKLRDLRLTKNISQADLAKKLQISRFTLHRFEKGAKRMDRQLFDLACDLVNSDEWERINKKSVYSMPPFVETEKIFKLRDLRNELHISQFTLGRKIGASSSKISDWENFISPMPLTFFQRAMEFLTNFQRRNSSC